MSTVNQIYTFQYTQPEGYRFSQDSVFLAQFVFSWIQKNPGHKINRMADLCSGCGIVGLDLLFHLSQNHKPVPLLTDFIEVQPIYQSFFEKNKQTLLDKINTDMALNYVSANYADLIFDQAIQSKYDLIVCNPPYFKTTQGRLSPSEFKNRCRFFMDSDFPHLIKFLEHALSETGTAFVLLRSLIDHGDDWNLTEIFKSLKLSFEYVGIIRGTDVILIYKSM